REQRPHRSRPPWQAPRRRQYFAQARRRYRIGRLDSPREGRAAHIRDGRPAETDYTCSVAPHLQRTLRRLLEGPSGVTRGRARPESAPAPENKLRTKEHSPSRQTSPPFPDAASPLNSSSAQSSP